jgi:glycosyltransferase involved in cell wall biosynthesis
VTPNQPKVLFLGSGYAGHRTRFTNLQQHSEADARMRPSYRLVTGWHHNGLIERAPLLAAGVKGRLRAMYEAAPLARIPRPDAIWLGAGEAVTPFLWSQSGPMRRPMVKDLDATVEQLNELSPIYFGRPPKRGTALAIALAAERWLWRSVSLFTPWSQWAADGLRARGVPEARIRVLPPGVNLTEWCPRPDVRSARSDEGRLRLLFVGGDFARKGGHVLLDVFRSRFTQLCQLDVVTRDPVDAPPGVQVHRLEANDTRLRALYAECDVFVLPTQAECFGMATVEALASGLPVIVSDRGGARDIVTPGVTGWLIEPDAPALADALTRALTQRERLSAMGQAGRATAVTRFDGLRNDQLLVDLVLETVRHAP